MKILKLRFKNLNSLVGEWEIDFTLPQYIHEGIFAITGPTGAGKSTILDAICLALYAETPRLGRISASSNEIMSRKTGNCFAEVVFESEKGIFRTHWSQRRSRDKADGALQPAKFEISDVRTDLVIENQLEKTKVAIEERTGMDFGRFTQSMMLAQGGFAAFLQATDSERAPILEEITGTSIYSELSKLTFARHKEEKEKLERLQLLMGEIKTLTDEEKLQYESEQAAILPKIEEHSKIKKLADDALAWLNQLEKLDKQLENLKLEEQKIKQAIVDFEPERITLVAANKAQELEGQYAQLRAVRKALADSTDLHANAKAQIPILKNALDIAINTETETKKIRDKTAADGIAARKTIVEVRELDTQIFEKQKQVEEATKKQELVAGEVEKLNKDILNTQSVIERADLLQKNALEYLTQYATDESLIENAGVLKADLNTLITTDAKINTLKNEISSLKKMTENKQQALSEFKTKIEIIQTKKEDIEASKKELLEQQKILLKGRSVEDYNADLEMLTENLVLRQRIESLESHRAQLQDGKACPLCGSLHHPYAQGNVPASNEITVKIQALKNLLQSLAKNETQTRTTDAQIQIYENELTTARAKLQIAQNELNTTSTEWGKKQQEYSKLMDEREKLIRSVDTRLKNYKLTLHDNPTINIAQIDKRVNDWKTNIEIKNAIGLKIDKLKAELKTQLALQKNAVQHLEDVKTEVKNKNAAYTLLCERRKELFGDKNTDTEEQSLLTNEKKANENHAAATEKLLNARNAVKVNAEKLEEYEKTISALHITLQKAESEFIQSLTTANFGDENEFIKARMSAEMRNHLHLKEQELKLQSTRIKALIESTNKAIETEKEKKLTDEMPEHLMEKSQEAATQIALLQARSGQLTSLLHADTESRKRSAQLLADMTHQTQSLRKWAQLNDAIGSADGNKFRSFAQGLTFEIMVGYANQQLRKLSDRYQLVRSIEKPLSLNIIDQYQAGEQRSTKNLSGGESFLVSLALALGLSKMASRNVRIDSLFLDEGFGSLDEDTLDTALNTLASLQHDGKLIGVISHVAMLKDRIGTRITVEKQTAGRSTLSGPGCRKL